MSGTEELLASFERSWKEFSSAWKKARSKASEASIHDLRVSVRRLIAALELARGLSKHKGIATLERRFKKVLKRMGSLRDVQVQLQNVSQLAKVETIQNFKDALERREERQIEKIGKKLKGDQKDKLSEGVKAMKAEFERLGETRSDDKIRESVHKIVDKRRDEFLKCRSRFNPSDAETLHKMRISLKQLRYAVEAANPILGSSARQRARKMQSLQRLMGDTRDVELLRAELDKWASKKGKKLAVVPALDRLEQKRQQLLKKIVESASILDNIWPPQRMLKPVVEKVQVAKETEKETKKAGENVTVA